MIIGRVFDAVNGTVALTSDGNVGFTPDADYNGPAQFSYEANTPEGGEAIATVFIDVTPVNDAPTARNDTGFSGDENTTFVIAAADLLANDSDIDGDGFGLLSVASTAQLLVSLNADGDVEVTPVPDFFGPATFSYTIEDSGGATSEATVFVTVDAVNSLPTAVDDRFELTQAGDPILEDNPIIINLDQLVANDFDLDGDDLVLSRAFGATNGRVQLLDNQTVLFEPTENFNGEATFQYEIDDGQGGTDTGTATIVYQPVNDRPDARFDRYNDDTLIVLQGTQDQDLVIPIAELLKNDFDIEGFAVTFENATGPVNGDLVVDGDSIIFTPDPGFYGQATFGYSISDPEGLVDGALVTMFFAATSDVPPLPENDQFLVAEDIPTVIRLDTLLANDIDPDADPIQVTGFRELNGLADAFKFGGKAAGPLNGTLELNADGDILFTPFIDATLSSGFVYRVSDGEDGVTEAFVDIEIVPSNDDPTVVEDPGFVTPFDVPLVIRTEDLLFNDYDIEQADTDGDGTIDVPLDDPDRPRPEFVAVDAFLDPVELAQGNRVNVGTFEIVDFRGDSFVVARFDQGFTGEVIIEYRIADEEGLEDTGFAYANVADFYDGTLTGTPFIDYIEGNALSETILGYRRDDWIVALAGDDTIVTGLGEDLIEAGIGDDVINPGDDADDVRGGLGFDTVLFAGSNTGVRADLQTLIGQGGFAQGDLYSGIEAFEGTAFNDTLGGDDAANSLSGLGGNDELVGRGGVDTLLGGDGEDTLDGGADGDTLDGGDDSDTASYFFSTAGVTISLADGTASGGWAEGDSLISIENVLGTEFVDAITGNDADNYLSGDRGDDTLDGGGGDDTLSGGRGGDELIGGDGTDTADYSLSVDGINIDLAAGTASGGDAEGDTLDGIEVIRASFQDDVLAGDGGDNHFRGSRGADDIDGRDGVDTADYATADEAVHVDLSLGQGLAGEALGDTLTSIEKLIGSTFDDTFVGSAMAEVFDGRFGADLLQGRAGSDDYLFGFDSGADLIEEDGDDADTDRLVLGAGIGIKDVSLLRFGDDLFVELERDDGFLIDTVTVVDHFLGRAIGIEEIVFDDGTIWDRAFIEANLRDGRFNAADDVFLLGIEDEVAIIDPADLFLNDVDTAPELLSLVSVQGGEQGTASINADGLIEFLGAPDFNGDAFFSYTVADGSGRESTARVEVNLSPVNDAPVANDDPLVYGVEDEILRIRIENLLANDFDVDGDAEMEGLRITGAEPLTNLEGEALRPYSDNVFKGDATDAGWRLAGDYIEFISRPDHFGFAGFRYTLSDNDGATDTADVEIYFAPVNDAPRNSGRAVSAKLEETTDFTVDQLMAQVYDVEGDDVSFVGLSIAADGNASTNGVEVFDEANGIISFTPFALGAATISFDVIDARGAEATLEFEIQVRPQNLDPIARDDRGIRALEDETILIDPDTLLANDGDPDDDPVFFEDISRFAENGKVRLVEGGMIEFVTRENFNGTASFEYFINDGRGGTDSATAFVTILPRNNAPELRNDVVAGLEDGPLFVIPAEAFGNDRDLDGDVIFFEDTDLLGVLPKTFLNENFTVEAKLPNNADLPDWLFFDAATMTFSGTVPTGQTGDLPVSLFIVDPSTSGAHRRDVTLDTDRPGDLAAGVSFASVLDDFELRGPLSFTLDEDADAVATFDISAGTFSASRQGGRPLPDWLTFDEATRQFALSGIEPDEDAQQARVQVVFTPDPRPDLPEDEFYATSQGFTLEFVLQPGEAIDPAINALLAGDPAREALGFFDVDLSTAAALSASRESGAPLNSWLDFDESTLTFAGTPPSEYVGAVPVRIDVEGGPSVPTMSIITEVVVDETFAVVDAPSSLRVFDTPERINLISPEDFNGSVAFTYTANDGKGAVSEDPAIIVFNILAQRELPEAGADAFTLFENEVLVFSESDLLANDRDDDGDTLSIIGFGTVANGAITDNGDGTFTYTPNPDFSGEETVSYTLDDGAEGPAEGTITFEVISLLEPPVAETDRFDGTEDTPLVLTPADLLANDSDIDGDTIEFLGVTDGDNGTVLFDGVNITFTPTPNFDGRATFTYTITDNTHGQSDGTVLIDVASTNVAPEAVLDVIATDEDTPVEFSIEDLLLNDFDPDGDTVSFLSLQTEVGGGRLLELPDGRYQFVPDENVNGAIEFSYSITDGRLNDRGIIRFDVAPVNDAPIANPDGLFYGDQDTPLVIDFADLIANDRDVEGDSFEIVDVFDGDNGTVTRDGDTAVFLGRPGYFGDGGFNYRVTDSEGATSTGYASVLVFPQFAVPVAVSDAGYEMLEDDVIILDPADLMANDDLPLGSEVTFLGLTTTLASFNAQIEELADGTYRVTAPQDYFGELVLRYALTNETGFEVPTTVTIDVLPVDDAPVAVDDLLLLQEDRPRTIFVTELTRNDFDVDLQAITLTRILDTDGVSVELTGDGQIVVTPGAEFIGTGSFDYELRDSTGITDVGRVTVKVESLNDAPVIAPIEPLIGTEDTAFSATLPSDVVTDADGDALFIELRSAGGEALPDWLSFDAETLAISGLPPQDFNGDVALELFVSDGVAEALQPVTLTIAAVNDAPVIADIGELLAFEDVALDIALPEGTVSDVDGDPLTIELTGPAGSAIPAWIAFDPDTLTLSGTPPLNENGIIDLELSAFDGVETVTSAFTLILQAVNDAPGTLDDQYQTQINTPISVDFLTNDPADVENDPVFVDVGDPLNGSILFDGTQYIYIPDIGFEGDDSFEYRRSDFGGASSASTVTITVNAGTNTPPVAVDDAETVAEDSSVTVSVLANDEDEDGDTLTVTGASAPSNGTAVVNTDGTITYTPNPDYFGNDSFTYDISDANGGTDTATVEITIAPVNDPPVPVDDFASVDEDGSVDIDVTLNDIDVDSTILQLKNIGFASNGVVTKSGNIVTYMPNPDFFGTDTFTYNIDDELIGNTSGLATVTVTVNPVNDPPVAVDDGATTNEDTAVVIDLLANDSDVDGDSLNVTVIGAASNGTVVDNGDGTVTYTPDPDYNGPDSFTYTVSDGTVTDTATVNVTVDPVNDPPVAVDDGATTNEDTAVVINVLANDSDVDGDTLTITAVGTAGNGTVVDNGDGTVTYTPDPDYNGPDSFTYTVSDGTVTDTATVNVTVNPVNDPPVAVDDGYATSFETTLNVAAVAGVLDNDTDVEGDALTAVLQDDVTNGTLTLNSDGSFDYTPDAGFSGTDSFTYFANDGTENGLTPATVTITVNAATNTPPVAVDDGATTNEDTAVVIDLLANDSDVDGDSLNVTVIGAASNGTVVDNGDGTVTYTPDPDYNGPDSFTYTVSDGTVTDTATVNVTVDPVNDPPVAVDDGATTNEDTAVVINVLANDSDVDGDTLTITAVGTAGNGTVVDNGDGTVTYTPDPDYNGPDSFTYTVSDGTVTDTATVNVTVNPVNDPPVAVDDGYATSFETTLNVAAVAGVLDNDTDVEGDALTAVLQDDVTNGTLTLNSDGSFDYTPDAGFSGTDSFTYFANDGTENGLTPATVTITVNAATNTPPVAVDDGATTNEDTAVVIDLLANDSDVDGDSLNVTVIGAASNGTVVDNGDGTVSYTPDPDYNGPDSFTYTVSDGTVTDTATVNVTVDPVNDPPVAVDDGATTNEDTAVVINVLANDSDVDGDTLTITAVGTAGNGTVVDNGDGTVTYTPDPDYNGPDSFTYTVSDGTVTDTATVNVTVNPVNDPPVAVDDGYATSFETTLNVAAVAGVLDNDTDVEGDALTAVLQDDVTNGTLTLNSDGSFDYTPDAGFSGTDSFTYFANDGTENGLTPATVTITVNAATNTPPVAVDDGATTNEDTAVVIDLLANDSDVDGDSLNVTVIGAASNGTVVDNGDGTVTYTPDPDYNGPDSFTYTVSDGTVTDTATVNVTVDPVNDPPVAVDDGATTNEDTAVVINVLANDSDVDGDTLTITAVGTAGNGTVVDNGDGTVTYTPDPDYNGPDSFTYTVSDGTVTDTATVNVTVNPVNDPPVAVDDGYATSFETTLNVAAVAGVLDNDTDVEGDALTAVLQDDVTNGTLTLNSDGSFDYTPDAGFSGTDSFTYFANDGTENGLTPATVTITVGSQPPPDPTELTFNGSTYLILQDGLSRAEAEAQAAALGGTLLRIDSQAEQDWVTANIWNQQAIYLDASDAATEGVWVDSDGTPLAYTNWMPGEPNDGGGNQDYALLASSDGGWDDQGRDGSDIFTDRWFGTAAMSVVEIVGGDPPPDTGGDPPPDTGGDPPPDTGGDPPPDGGDPPPAGLTFGGSTYVILDDGLSRAEAQAQAAALGGTLLRIGSQAEQDWVMANIWDQQAIYLDASDAATEGVWVDSDGTPLAYTNWMPGEPNDGGGNQDYALLASSDGGWDDQGRDGSDIFTDRWFGTAAMSVVEIVGGDPPPDTGGDPPPDTGGDPPPDTGGDPPPDGGDPPPAGLTFGGSTYVILDDGLSRAEAQAQAAALGGTLLRIDSQAEQDWVTANIWNQQAIYLDASDAATEGVWVDSDGTPLAYTNWMPGEPNDGGGNQDYALLASSDGGWDDQGRDGSDIFTDRWFGTAAMSVVEIVGGDPPPDTGGDPPPDGGDPPPAGLTFGGSTYFILSDGLTRAEALAEAAARGGTLLSIDSQAEQDWVMENLWNDQIIFLDASDEAVEGTFVDSDGAPLAYTNWLPGEPNNSGGNQDYALLASSDGGWDDQNENESVGLIDGAWQFTESMTVIEVQFEIA
jgi:hypothetical protein